jgi:hypothetical protein
LFSDYNLDYDAMGSQRRRRLNSFAFDRFIRSVYLVYLFTSFSRFLSDANARLGAWIGRACSPPGISTAATPLCRDHRVGWNYDDLRERIFLY